MSDVHAVHISLNELLDHARNLFNPSPLEWTKLCDALEYVWRHFSYDDLIQTGVSTCIVLAERFLDESDDDDEFDFTEMDFDIQTTLRSLFDTYETSAMDESEILAISTFAETLHDFILEYLDISNWLGDLSLIERLGERFTLYFG